MWSHSTGRRDAHPDPESARARGGEKRDSVERPMGVGLTSSMSMELDIGEENFRSRTAVITGVVQDVRFALVTRRNQAVLNDREGPRADLAQRAGLTRPMVC